jgi:2-deoxy-D-gluconate 3-dehydrogenase
LNLFNSTDALPLSPAATPGLGQGMALALAQAGADIVGVNVTAPDDTKSQIEAGRRFLDLRANLSDVSCIEALVTAAKALTGKVDILVNNAGIIRREDAIKFQRKRLGRCG